MSEQSRPKVLPKERELLAKKSGPIVLKAVAILLKCNRERSIEPLGKGVGNFPLRSSCR